MPVTLVSFICICAVLWVNSPTHSSTANNVFPSSQVDRINWASEIFELSDQALARKVLAVQVSEAQWEHDEEGMVKLNVTAGDFAAKERAWIETLLKAPAPIALVDAMKDVDIVFTAMGTSRANKEMQEAQEETSYHEGFATWLRRVDAVQNAKLAQAAKQANAKGIVRVSAMSANANAFGSEQQFWGWYARYQGLGDELTKVIMGAKRSVILNPGGLDRGERFRQNRPWEIQKHQMGPGLPVIRVAEQAVAQGLALANGAGSGHEL